VEIILNLAWAALAVLIFCLWFRIGDRTGIDRRRQMVATQIVAILVLIAILFPVISVSDDLMAMQNATEQDGSQRRDHLGSAGDPSILPPAEIASVLNLDAGCMSVRYVAGRTPSSTSIEHPELAGIENRPPPVA
jgi:hypothetical protein